MFEAFRCQAPPLRAATARAASSLPDQTAAPAAATPPRAAKKRRTQGSGGVAAAAPAAAQQPAGLALEKMGDQPLRLIIVGHNPSEHAWSSGHFYSNPSNWMWRILRDTGIAPATAIRGAEDDGRMPEVTGVGFTDVGSGNPGTDSSQFGSAHFATWRPGFFGRLEAQARRASAAIGCTCGRCGAPAVVAFSGKKQFQELFASGGGGSRRGRQKKAASAGAAASAAAGAEAAAAGSPLGSPQQAIKAAASAAAATEAEASPAAAGAEASLPAAAAGGKQPSSRADGSSAAAGSNSASAERRPVLQARRPASIATGRQWVLPDGWPLPLTTEVWVMTSTSGAAPMTREQRYTPWQALAERLAREPWPRQCQLRCGGSADG